MAKPSSADCGFHRPAPCHAVVPSIQKQPRKTSVRHTFHEYTRPGVYSWNRCAMPHRRTAPSQGLNVGGLRTSVCLTEVFRVLAIHRRLSAVPRADPVRQRPGRLRIPGNDHVAVVAGADAAEDSEAVSAAAATTTSCGLYLPTATIEVTPVPKPLSSLTHCCSPVRG